MIELRALSYFAVACRSDTLARAADTLGIALSTLSTALKSLEGASGLTLFKRTKSTLYPTASARWLMRIAEPTLAAEALGRRCIATSRKRSIHVLNLEIALNFTIGGISEAIQCAAAVMARDAPHVLVDPVWIDERDTPRVEHLDCVSLGGESSSLDIGLRDERSPSRKDYVAILSEPWAFACRLPADTRHPPNVDDLISGHIVVPALPQPLIEQAERYFSRNKRGGVRFVNEHPGELPRLIDENPDAAFFVPESLISPDSGLQHVWAIAPKLPLRTNIVAQTSAENALARRFIGHLRKAFATSARFNGTRPAISARQVHYFNLAQRFRRVSAAGRGANVSQPALSEQLGKLETTLGVKLFERHGDGVTPTIHGERFTGVTRTIELSLHRIATDGVPSAAPLARRVAIGILPSVSQHGHLVNRMTEAVMDVQARHPGLKLVMQEAPNGTLQEWVMRGLVGVAIVETSLPRVPRLPLGSSEALAVIAHARHGLLRKGPVAFRDLLRLPIVLPTRRSGLRHLLEAAADQYSVKIVPYMEIDALTMIVAVLAQAPVCTVLPPSAVTRELERGELIAHPIVDPVIARRLFVIYSGERSLSAPERDLIKTLRGKLSKDDDPE